MAAVHDLLPLASALAAVVTYNGAPPAWLTNAARIAEQGTPVVVNTKGIAPDATPCIISLAQLERLTAAAGGGGAQSCPADDLQTDAAAKFSRDGENGFLCGGHDAAQG